MVKINKKAYMAPETVTLSLESIGPIMGADKISGNGTGDPPSPAPGKFGAPKKVF